MTKADGEVLLIGPGLMGREYAKILLALKIPFRTIGRSERTCSEFEKATGAKAESIGLEAFPREEIAKFARAIVATDTELMAAHAVLLMQCGVRKILLEKPGGVDQQEIQHVNRIAAETKSDVVIAYNRRFYAAVLELKNRIVEDGGLKSVFFDFTEWPFKIEALPYPEKVKQNWILRNSSHVIDLVFYLAGPPREFNSFSGGELKWHARSVFVGAGITEKGIFFSYHSNWESAGRWRIELHTGKNKWILCPLEELHYMPSGSVQVSKLVIDDERDREYKPGMLQMTRSWLDGKTSEFSDISDQTALADLVYNQILNSKL